MKRVPIDKLKGNEILGNDILSNQDTILIAKGTVLKHEYIYKLKDLGVTSVMVREDKERDVTSEKIEKVKKKTGKMVKRYLEQHIHQQREEMTQLCKVVEDIIDDVMQEEEVIDYTITIKNEKTDMYVHSMQVCTIASMLAAKRNLPKDVIRDIAKGSILHDIGLRYLTIPYEDVDMNEAAIKEQIEYKKHVIYGYDAIKDETWLSPVCKSIILYHHECPEDGSGFPFKMKRDKLSEAVEIVAISDAFDRMVCGIGCKKLKINEVVEYMKSAGVKKYGFSLVDDLLSMIAVYPTGINVVTNTGEKGFVLRQNKNFVERPVLMITHDANGQMLSEGKEVDLIKELSVFITEEIS